VTSTALAAASGALLALSFPKFGHPACAWIALAPLLVALRGTRLTRAFLLGLLTGIIYFTGTLYWISRVMVRYGDLQPPVAVLVNAVLVAYLAFFPALFAIVVRRLTIAFGPRALAAAPIVWIATELGRNYPFGGFPWVLLGYSQVTVLPIAQFASIFGVHGVSLVVAGVSTALVMSAQPWPHAATNGENRRGRIGRAAPLACVLAAVIALAAWGARRTAAAEWTHAGDPVRVGLIQGNVSLEERAEVNRRGSIFANYLSMSRQAIRQGAELVIWPESATPFQFENDVLAAGQIRTLARQAGVTILVGSDQVEPARSGLPAKYYNSAFLVQRDGTTGGAYRKMHLVPFGEYVPARWLFFFAAPLVEAVSDFSPGETPTLLPVEGHRVSTAICYEVIYPDLVRQFVLGGSELLTTITNDAWFGETSAPYQHFDQAAMRAIEEGRYLVRSANTGVSGIVDPYGRVLERTPIFQQAVTVGEARFLNTSTFYARHGEVLARTAVVVSVVLLVVGRRRVE
jgi:apolipoprotein N-acyltransferase